MTRVKKLYQGQSFGIFNDDAHFVMYRTYPSTTEKAIKTRDQFGARILNVFRSVLLAAPCRKLDWKVMD